MRDVLIASLAAFLVLSGTPLVAQERPTDEWLTDPVDGATFAAYADFFTYEQDLPFDVRTVSRTSEGGVDEELLRFQSTAGVVVPARLYRPAGIASSDLPVVIYLHGGSISGKDGTRFVSGARFYARAGLAVLTIDMPHFGEREDGGIGSGSEQDKHDLLYNNEAAYLDWLQQTVRDIRRSYDFLTEERGYDPGRIGLMGASRGAVVATIAAGIEERFGAVLLLHGGHFDYFEERHRAAACPANYVGRISSPVFFLNSETDQDFLLETAIRPMHALAPEGTEFRWTTAGGHGAMDDEDRSVLMAWLRSQLGG